MRIMDDCGKVWKRVILVGVVLVTILGFVESAGTSGSEWSLGPTEEYTRAFINLTYLETDKLHTEKSDVGKFGTGKVGPASGIVVHVYSGNRTDWNYGCDFPYGNQLPNEPWIALVKRGNCSFDKKLANAVLSNASGLVVYDKEDKAQLEKMTFKNCSSSCDIPTVFTYKWKGEEIASKVDSGKRVQMYITVGETCSRPYSGINRTSVLFVSISFIVLMIISLAWLVFYYVQRFRYLHAKDRLALRLCYAAKKALAKIPTRNIKLTDKEISGEGECCAVCIELYRSGETLRTLPCRHEFHKCCVDPWLLEHRTCPMCKMDILKYYGFIFTGSQESILHLDMEDGILNSSESRETETPIQETLHQHHHHHTHTHAQHHVPTTSTALNSLDEPPQASTTNSATQATSTRKASLISLTVVASPQGPSPSEAEEGSKTCLDHDTTTSSLKLSPLKPEFTEVKKSNSKSSLHLDDSKCHDICQASVEDEPMTCSYQETKEDPEADLPNSSNPLSQPLLDKESGSLTPKSQHGSTQVLDSLESVKSGDSVNPDSVSPPTTGDEGSAVQNLSSAQ